MLELAAPLARILLRYVIGGIILKFGASIDVNDPDLVNMTAFILSSLLGAGIEAWYWLARKRGWRT